MREGLARIAGVEGTGLPLCGVVLLLIFQFAGKVLEFVFFRFTIAAMLGWEIRDPHFRGISDFNMG